VDVTRYVYDGKNLLQERDTGTAQAEFTYQPLPQANLLSQTREDESSFYHFDGIHNTSDLTDESGTVTDQYRFDAWGKLTSSTGGTANANTYKGEFLAYRQDPHAGPETTYSLTHRDISADTGRHRSPDPAEDKLNPYPYASNNPVNRADPSGLAELVESIAGQRINPTRMSDLPLRLQMAIRDGDQIRYHGNGSYSILTRQGEVVDVQGPISRADQIANVQSSQQSGRIINAANAAMPNIPQSVVTRIEGVGQVSAAGAEGLGAAALLGAPDPTLATKAGAVVVGGLSIDNAQAGMRKIIWGESVPTVVKSVATAGAELLGADPQTADLIGTGTEISVNIGGPLAAQRLVQRLQSGALTAEELLTPMRGTSQPSITRRYFGQGETVTPPVTPARIINNILNEGGATLFKIETPNGRILEVLTESIIEGDKLILRGTHIGGASPGEIGIQELKEIARQHGRQQGVKQVIVEGARRSTGRMKGQVPRPWIIEVE